MTDSTLSDLFAQSDAIGDKYLSDEEIKARDAELAQLQAEIAAISN